MKRKQNKKTTTAKQQQPPHKKPTKTKQNKIIIGKCYKIIFCLAMSLLAGTDSYHVTSARSLSQDLVLRCPLFSLFFSKIMINGCVQTDVHLPYKAW
jgi:hypothetical protein